MAAPFSKREKLLLTGLLVFAAISALFTLNSLNHASRHNAFIGDSLTVMWDFPRSNLGIPGQTSTEILARFHYDIADQGYRKVFILAGSNDILHGVDPSLTLANLEAMADLTLQANAQPILAEIPPIYRDNGKFLPAVRSLNARIAQLAARRSFKLIDYYDAMNNRPNEYVDGVHIKPRSYLRMERALLRVTNPF